MTETTRASRVWSVVSAHADSLDVPVSLRSLCQAAAARLPVSGIAVSVHSARVVCEVLCAIGGLSRELEELQLTVGEGPSSGQEFQDAKVPCVTVIGQLGIRDRLARLASVARAQDPGVTRVRRLTPSAGHPGVVMRIPGPSRSFGVARPPRSSRWRPAFRPVWRMLVGWSARTPVGYGSTGSSGRQPEPGGGVRGRNTAAGPGGGAALVGASVAPPPIFSPVEPTAAAHITDSRELSERRVDAGHSTRLAALSGPDREIVLSRVVVGPLGALRSAATANGPPPARKRVVLLPHARTEPTDTRPDNRRTGRGPDMNQDDPPRRHPAQGDDATGAITTSRQWHDAELAMKVARHSFESWLVAGHEDTPSLALMHAYHTHTALHEAARAITTLIETFRVEAAALITSRPAPVITR